MARRVGILLSCALVACALVWTTPATGSAPASLRLRPTVSDVADHRYDSSDPIFFDPGVWISSRDGAFELRVRRKDYDTAPTIKQVDADSGEVVRHLPFSSLDGWRGLKNFFHVTVRDDSDAVMLDQDFTFCPTSWNAQRVNTNGPATSRYPTGCWSGPFTKGAVWGIDHGWAVDPWSTIEGSYFDGPDGHYTIDVQINPFYANLFDIPHNRSSATVGLDVTTDSTGPPFRPAAMSVSSDRSPKRSQVPTIPNPDPSLLPDLSSLPAWNFQIATDTATNDDLLTFGATEWNNGPQPMVVEGYRRPGTNTMDAFQYFYRHGRPVGRAKVGTMDFDSDLGHDHWHFEQFAEYSLLDANKQLVVPSEKTGFCLAPTDAIDLTTRGALWRPDTVGLTTACGDASAIWIREVLPVGWGDTYYQYKAGQSFDVNALPNGTYYVKIRVNPLGKLYERNPGNDTALREVILGGTPGARTVTAPPWHGIDTECSCF